MLWEIVVSCLAVLEQLNVPLLLACSWMINQRFFFIVIWCKISLTDWQLIFRGICLLTISVPMIYILQELKEQLNKDKVSFCFKCFFAALIFISFSPTILWWKIFASFLLDLKIHFIQLIFPIEMLVCWIYYSINFS